MLLSAWLGLGQKLGRLDLAMAMAMAHERVAARLGLVQVLQRARGVDNVEIELEDIVEAARQSRMIKNPYRTILQRKYRPQFIIACIFMIFQQFDVRAPNKGLAPVLSQPAMSSLHLEQKDHLRNGACDALLNKHCSEACNALLNKHCLAHKA